MNKKYLQKKKNSLLFKRIPKNNIFDFFFFLSKTFLILVFFSFIIFFVQIWINAADVCHMDLTVD